MNTKKILSLILTIVMILSLFGCKNSNPDTSESSDSNNPSIIDTVGTTGPNSPTKTTTVPAHTHEWADKDIAATCTTGGYSEHICSICGEKYKDNETPALGHTWGSWETTKEATSTETGSAERTCTVCGEKETRVIAKVAAGHKHSYTKSVTSQPTCSKVGTATYTCSCGDAYTEDIAKTDHDYTTKTVAATCTMRGYTEHTCKNCNISYKDNYTAIGKHDYTSSVVAATCTSGGYTTYVCKTCGDTYVSDKTSAKGHSWSSWKTVREPTTTSTGVSERSCSACGAKETNTIDKLPTTPTTQPTQPTPTQPKPTEPPVTEHTHNYVVTDQKDATCETAGYITKTCSCGDVVTTTIDALGHNWEHHHQDEVGHYDVVLVCTCGWSCPYDDNYLSSWRNHINSLPSDEKWNHSYTDDSVWVVDTPAKDWDVCTRCGTTK